MNLIIPQNGKFGSSREYAYRVLLSNIIQWNLLPGEVLRDAEISELLGVSRTPVREAINSLRDDQLVTVGSSTHVSLIDEKMVYEGLYIRTAMETLIAEDICGRLTHEQQGVLMENLERQRLILEGNIGKKNFCELDDEFHGLFYRFADREFSHRIVSKACHHLNRTRNWTFFKSPMDLTGIYELHCAIFQAAVDGDHQRLKRLCREHCFGTHLNYHAPQLEKTILAQHPEYFTNPKEMLALREKISLALQRGD